MSRASASQHDLVSQSSDVAEHPSAAGPEDASREPQATTENTQGELPATEEVVAELSALQPLAVRETQRLYRLKASRFVALVAADSEDEARSLAAGHDPLQGDWRNPEFASVEFEDTSAPHVFGDVIISALAAPPAKRAKKR